MSRLDAALQPPPREATPMVPRRASFDDLRVGMVVARWSDEPSIVAAVVGRLASMLPGGEGWRTEADEWITRPACERGEVTILRDAPAEPVRVRREDYDALVRALAVMGGVEVAAHSDAIHAAAALIDNADVGADS